MTIGELFTGWKRKLKEVAENTERELEFAREIEVEKEHIEQLHRLLYPVSCVAESQDYEFGALLNSLEYRQKNVLVKLKSMGRQTTTVATGNILQSFADNLHQTEEEARRFDADIKLNPTNEYLDRIFDNLQAIEREVRSMNDDIDQVVRSSL